MDVDAYLVRLGLGDRPGPTLEGLRRLQDAHQQSVPFENLSVHLPEPIVLDEAALFHKVVVRRRGGFCYELNGLFAALLRELGFTVDLLAARVVGQDGALGIPHDHLTLRVTLDGQPWLSDVGFGRLSRHPLAMDGSPQHDPDGHFSVVTDARGGVGVRAGDTLVYVADMRPAELHDFVAGCWWHATSPVSGFGRQVTCSRLTPDGRVRLAGRVLKRTVGGTQTEQQINSDEALLEIYRTTFGMELDRVPTVRPEGKDPS